MSDSWPEKVCTRFSDFMSKIIACASHAPVKVPGCFGLIASDIPSPLCPLKVDFAFPVSRPNGCTPGRLVRCGRGGRRVGAAGGVERHARARYAGAGAGRAKGGAKGGGGARARAPDDVRISVFSMKRQHER